MSDEGDRTPTSVNPNKPPADHWYTVRRPVCDSEEKHESGSSKVRVNFYNENISRHDRDIVNSNYKGPEYTAKAVHKWLNGEATKSILDVAAGNGKVVVKLKEHGNYISVDGLDPAEDFLQDGFKRGLYRKIFPMYFYVGCGLEENSYDALCCSGGLVPGHIRSESLEEMCRVVKPGGFVVLVTAISYLVNDEDLQRVPAVIERMVKKNKWEVLDDHQVPDFSHGNVPGQVFVFRKL